MTTGGAGARASASVPTPNGARYVDQLCKHWAHKLVVERADANARIILPSGADVQLAPAEDALSVTIEAADTPQLDEAKGVVERHLDRFAFREAPLPFDWRD